MTEQHHKAPVRAAKASICQTRRIKVTQTYYDYRPKDYPAHRGLRSVPWIQMRGYWLEQAGFTINTPIKIRVMDGCLVLTSEQIDTP